LKNNKQKNSSNTIREYNKDNNFNETLINDIFNLYINTYDINLIIVIYHYYTKNVFNYKNLTNFILKIYKFSLEFSKLI
jgi:hypothetical protein